MSSPLILLPYVSFPLFSLCLTEESLCSNSENLSPGEEFPPPPPPPQYEFSQKAPDGSGCFCWGLSVRFLCSSLFLDTHYSITHAPAALVSFSDGSVWTGFFMLVAIENGKPFRVSLQSLVLISLQYSILEELFYDGAVKITSFSWVNDESLEQDRTMLVQSIFGVIYFQFWVVTLNVILGLGNWMGSIIVATFSGITSTLRISAEIVKLNFGEVQRW